ncbi:MAG: C40 family peptidase [Rhizobiaceae bacterium]|nr:C40 family peptidase [Rhizobiaceae bacterium]
MTTLDHRLNAFRPDLADLRLEGHVAADSFTAGREAQVAVAVADLRGAPRSDAGLSTQLLLGAAVTVFDEADGWAWVQARRDGYVGYLPWADIRMPGATATHRVCAPRTFLYPGPDLRLPRSAALSMGSDLVVAGHAETRGTLYAILDTGEAVIAAHLCGVDGVAADYVAVAESLLNTPYLWGGTSGFGIDCSGIVQLAMHMAGVAVLRDSDMQAATIGEALDPGPDNSGLRRGDLVFWKGHVGIMADARRLLHATGHTMLVTMEPLSDAIGRVAHLYGAAPTGFRRP